MLTLGKTSFPALVVADTEDLVVELYASMAAVAGEATLALIVSDAPLDFSRFRYDSRTGWNLAIQGGRFGQDVQRHLERFANVLTFGASYTLLTTEFEAPKRAGKPWTAFEPSVARTRTGVSLPAVWRTLPIYKAPGPEPSPGASWSRRESDAPAVRPLPNAQAGPEVRQHPGVPKATSWPMRPGAL